MIRSLFSAVLISLTAHNALAAPKPTLEVSIEDIGNPEAKSPDEDVSVTVFAWKTTGANEVLIMGYDTEPHPPNGSITIEGSFLFIARGPGGSVAEAVGGHTTTKPSGKWGAGRWGLIHELSRDFRNQDFFDFAAKGSGATKKTMPELVQIVSDVLSERGFASGSVKPSEEEPATIIFTLTYEPLLSLEQTEEQKRKEGTASRQAAFTILVDPGAGESNGVTIKVRPFVRINHPRDNDNWQDAPADTGLPEAQTILKEVESRAR
jgi:hypothetical protein